MKYLFLFILLGCVDNESKCTTDDSTNVAWVKEMSASGAVITTYWYDSTGAITVKGIEGKGCLAGFKVESASWIDTAER